MHLSVHAVYPAQWFLAHFWIRAVPTMMHKFRLWQSSRLIVVSRLRMTLALWLNACGALCDWESCRINDGCRAAALVLVLRLGGRVLGSDGTSNSKAGALYAGMLAEWAAVTRRNQSRGSREERVKPGCNTQTFSWTGVLDLPADWANLFPLQDDLMMFLFFLFA